MREQAGFAAFHLAFVVPGLALLYALGFVRRLRDVPAAIGPAYMGGIAIVVSLLIAFLTVGGTVRLPAFAVASATVTVVLAALGVVLRRRGRIADLPPRDPPRGVLETWAARVVIAALALFFVVGASAYWNAPVVGDDWTIWSYKALALFHFGSLDQELFVTSAVGPAHPYYPLLQPLLESLFFRSVGGEKFQEFHSVLWIVFGSFVWTALWLARTRGLPLLLLLAPTAALALTMHSHELIEIGYADMTMAGFAGAGALAMGLWLNGGGTRYAVLGAVFLMGAANTKNEGFMAAVAVLVVSGAIVALRERQRWRPWLLAAVVIVMGAAPFALWRTSKGIEPEGPPSNLRQALGPDHLIDGLDRIPKSFTAIFDQISDGGRWSNLVPCLLALSIVCLVRGVARREAAFYLGVPVLMTFLLVYVYWAGSLDIKYWLYFSADRTVAGLVMISGVGLIHLTALLLADFSRPKRGPP